MKGTEQFTAVIKNYLDDRAKNDELFAKRYANPKKNIEECISYILFTVKESGRNGFADDEIYGMAVHYYDEDNIKVDKAAHTGSVVVNHTIELTEEEKDQARAAAIEAYKEAEMKKMRERAEAERKRTEAKPKPSDEDNNQLDLFSMISDEA